MTHALIMIEKPRDTSQWSNLLSLHEQSKTLPKGTKRLPGCAWLIALDSGLPFLSELVRECVSGKHPYEVAFFDEAPRFISSSAASES